MCLWVCNIFAERLKLKCFFWSNLFKFNRSKWEIWEFIFYEMASFGFFFLSYKIIYIFWFWTRHFIAFVDNTQPCGLANSPIKSEQCKCCMFSSLWVIHNKLKWNGRQSPTTGHNKITGLLIFFTVYMVHFAHKFVYSKPHT